MAKLKIGSLVRVKMPGGGWSSQRRIIQFYDDIEGGCKLDAPVRGFVSWNVDDLIACAPTRIIFGSKSTDK